MASRDTTSVSSRGDKPFPGHTMVHYLGILHGDIRLRYNTVVVTRCVFPTFQSVESCPRCRTRPLFGGRTLGVSEPPGLGLLSVPSGPLHGHQELAVLQYGCSVFTAVVSIYKFSSPTSTVPLTGSSRNTSLRLATTRFI